MSITLISKSETLKNNTLERGHTFLLISLLDKKCIHLAIFYCPCSMYLSPIPLLIQSMPFFITLPWYHMPIVWMPHCNMLIVWLPLYLYANYPLAMKLYDELTTWQYYDCYRTGEPLLVVWVEHHALHCWFDFCPEQPGRNKCNKVKEWITPPRQSEISEKNWST